MYIYMQDKKGVKYMEDTIGRKEHRDFHTEFAERIDAENARQNKRLDLLEKSVNHINDLTISVEKMAVNMTNMLEAIERQGDLLEKQVNRIDEMEKEPARDQKEIKMEIIKTIISALVGAVVVAVAALL